MRNELVYIQDLDTTTTSQWLVPSQFVEGQSEKLSVPALVHTSRTM